MNRYIHWRTIHCWRTILARDSRCCGMCKETLTASSQWSTAVQFCCCFTATVSSAALLLLYQWTTNEWMTNDWTKKPKPGLRLGQGPRPGRGRNLCDCCCTRAQRDRCLHIFQLSWRRLTDRSDHTLLQLTRPPSGKYSISFMLSWTCCKHMIFSMQPWRLWWHRKSVIFASFNSVMHSIRWKGILVWQLSFRNICNNDLSSHWFGTEKLFSTGQRVGKRALVTSNDHVSEYQLQLVKLSTWSALKVSCLQTV